MRCKNKEQKGMSRKADKNKGRCSCRLGRKLLGGALKIYLLLCAVKSLAALREAEAEAEERRREQMHRDLQDWEFDRVYPGR